MDEIDANLVQGFLQSHNIIAEQGGGAVSIGSTFDPSASTRIPKGIYVPKHQARKAKELIKKRK